MQREFCCASPYIFLVRNKHSLLKACAKPYLGSLLLMGCGGSSPVAPEDDVPEIHQATREELIRSPVPDSVQAPIPVSAKPQSTGRGLHLTTAKLPTGKLTPKTTPWEVLHAEQLNTGVPHTEALAKCIKECEDAVDAILASLGDGEKFTDSWAVGPAALYTDGEAPCHDCTVTAPDEWRRLSEMCDAPVLISDSVSAGDVRQGSIGDCFLLSAIAAVASKRRELLVNNFVKYDVAKGVFGVRLFINGVWTFVIVDDFAAYTSDGQLVYASCANSSELWLPVLEKAIAKVCCCYENIDGGVTDWALEMLTGGLTEPGNEIVIADHEPAACWEKIDALLRRGDVLAVSSFSEGEYKDKGIEFGGGEGTAGEGVLACGLVAGHAYGLTACIEFEGTKLFKIRNPWGKRHTQLSATSFSPSHALRLSFSLSLFLRLSLSLSDSLSLSLSRSLTLSPHLSTGEGEWNGAWGDKSEEIQRPGAKEALGHTDEVRASSHGPSHQSSAPRPGAMHRPSWPPALTQPSAWGLTSRRLTPPTGRWRLLHGCRCIFKILGERLVRAALRLVIPPRTRVWPLFAGLEDCEGDGELLGRGRRRAEL